MITLVRKARPDDSARLAELMNIAGEGIPAFLWRNMAGPDEDPMAFGARRVARTEGGFSYVHAHVATQGETVLGMLLSYRLPDPYEVGSLDDLPTPVRPLVELEAIAPGSWYINAIATAPEHRGQGTGSLLMELAETQALASGAQTLSLIVAEQNARALALYRRLHYEVTARRPIAPFPGCPHTGDWVLMIREVGGG